MGCVDQACCRNNRRAVLIIVKDGNVDEVAEFLLNDKTFRRANIFKIYAAKTIADALNAFDERLRVFFFDDSVVNSYVVGTSAAQHMAGGELAPAVAELTSYWWDSYEEEMGPSPTMGLSSFGNADSNYADYLRHMLLAYGVTAAERDARIAAYRAAGNLRHGLRRGPEARGVGTELASVEAASKASRAKMSGLAETLGARFVFGHTESAYSFSVVSSKCYPPKLALLWQ